MKDPAFMFYPNDYAGGTMAMTRHQKGAYIDLLVAQFNLGDLSLVQIKTVLGVDFGSHWPTLQKKFTFDLVTELYYNDRLKQEMEKRKSYTASRRSNVSKRYVATTDIHMEDRDRDRDRNVLSINNTYGEFGNVSLNSEQYEKLVTQIGDKNLLILIGDLDRYIASNPKGKKYTNHYAVIQTWARRKFQEHVENNKPKRTIA